MIVISCLQVHPTSTHFFCCIRFVKQVQEKKVKKVSEMNVDPSKTIANGSVASSSSLSSPKTHLANGACQSFSSLSNDISFPPGGIPSLRLPQVVVLGPVYTFSLFLVRVCFFYPLLSIWSPSSPLLGHELKTGAAPAVLLLINFLQCL